MQYQIDKSEINHIKCNMINESIKCEKCECVYLYCKNKKVKLDEEVK